MAYNKKHNKDSTPFLSVLMLLIGVGYGIYIVRFCQSDDEPISLMRLVVLLLMTLVAFLLHTVLHETGHLIFGLLTGYRFCSFRIGNIMLLRIDGKLQFRRMSLAGTAGQCLLEPPDLTEGKMPVMLYHLGGVIMNFVVSVIFIILFVLFDSTPYAQPFCMVMAMIGMMLFFTNGIPVKTQPVSNDGYNARMLYDNPEAIHAMWIQMKVNGQLAQGVKAMDMPEEWFILPEEEKMDNCIVAALGVMAESRLMEEHRFEEAQALIERLFAIDAAIAGLHRQLLTCDLLYCALIGDGDKETVEALRSEELLKFMKQMKRFPMVMRTEYAFALWEQDSEETELIRKRFEKCAKTYPYKTDIEGERGLMKLAEERI